MYVLSLNMWFQKLMRQFFFNIDSVIFNFISAIYDLLISIARTSVLSQADIIDMADRIYKLLAIFMVFKVTFSLIMYVVNPDDFSDKSKGISKLGTNIIISLVMLIITPYVFNMAYTLQTIVLEDNAIAALIFGDDNEENDFLNSAGDSMAFISMRPFFMPNVSIDEMADCTTLDDTCFSGMEKLTSDDGNFTNTMITNYKAGIGVSNLGLMFRQDLAIATDEENDNFIMDYKYLFSTVIGVVIILLLITFCMDVAVRSIKLAFLQLIAPIPIISYVDPKSGKDGLFKKWYQMCFKTYLSLFIRILALYFAVYIISKIGKMVDIIDGSYQTNALIAIFIIIGALMFAKQLPDILKGFGLDLGDGKFSLNPLKKIEKEALGGEKIAKVAKKPVDLAKGAVKGVGTAALVGGASVLTGQGIRGMGKAFLGGVRGQKFGKNFSSSYSAARANKRKAQQMKLDGVKKSDVIKENLKNTVIGGATAKDEYDTFKSDLDVVTNGYKNYYSTILAADKIAKEFERRRVAAEHAGNDAEAKLWQDSIDNRVKTVTKNKNEVALNDTNNKAYETAEKMINEFRTNKDYAKATYGNKNSFESDTMKGLDKSDIVVNKGLENIQEKINLGVNELNSKFNGRFDYDGGLSTSDSLKAINGKARGYAIAAENSPEKSRIDSVYKYVNTKSNK